MLIVEPQTDEEERFREEKRQSAQRRGGGGGVRDEEEKKRRRRRRTEGRRGKEKEEEEDKESGIVSERPHVIRSSLFTSMDTRDPPSISPFSSLIPLFISPSYLPFIPSPFSPLQPLNLRPSASPLSLALSTFPSLHLPLCSLSLLFPSG